MNSPRDTTLVALLRLGGCLTGLAFFAIFLPTAWMATSHARLGLGVFPASPLVEYLARSVSGLYAMHGGLLLVLSTDVKRYAPVIAYVGVATAVFGLLVTGIDIYAGLPAYWTVAEGPAVTLIGIAIWVLARRAGAPDAESASMPTPRG